MGFLNRGGGGPRPAANPPSSGPALPNLGAPPPAGVEVKVGLPPVCPHCGKDPNKAPVKASGDDVKDMLEAIADADGTSAWEDGFIADQQENLKKFGSLTDKQMSVVERIYDERVKGIKRRR